VYDRTISSYAVPEIVIGTPDPRIGTELAGYRIDALLGAGGMGVVYRAHDPRLERDVALKLLPTELGSNRPFRERFLAESRLAASLEHPNIVPIHEAGEADGVLYIAMRYVEGISLAALLEREGSVDPERALQIVGAIGKAVDAAHASGLVHRDVKPSNVLLVLRGGALEHVYLADFGISKRIAGAEALTATGQVLGTVDYVAPDQIEGGSVDGRSDVYSLGAVLFECLAGVPPYRRDDPVSTIWAHVHDPVPSLSQRRPELPTAIDDVLASALAKDPSGRFPTCGELVAAARVALGLGEGRAPGDLQRPPPRALDEHCLLLLDSMLKGRVVPVLGPGANVCEAEHGRNGHTPPDGAGLAERLAGQFGYPRDEPLDLARVSQFVAVTRGAGPLHDELHDLLDVDYAPGRAHRFLARLPPLLRERDAPHQLIVTTNYDQSLERAFTEAGEELDLVSYIAEGKDRGKFWHLRPDGSGTLIETPNTYASELSLERRTIVLKIHGQVDRHPERAWESFAVTEDDHLDYLLRADSSGLVPVALAARLRRSHFLFLGYSPSEWGLRLILNCLWGDQTTSYRCWAVQHGPAALELEFWRYRGVDVLDTPLEQYVEVLDRHASALREREAPA
jgi:Protein kinase domain/SIR2-like domain